MTYWPWPYCHIHDCPSRDCIKKHRSTVVGGPPAKRADLTVTKQQQREQRQRELDKKRESPRPSRRKPTPYIAAHNVARRSFAHPDRDPNHADHQDGPVT